MAAELGHSDFKRYASPRRRLFENHAERCALEETRARTGLIGLLKETDKLHDPEELLARKVLGIDEVSERYRHLSSPEAFASFFARLHL